MRALILLLALQSPPLLAHAPAPRFMYIYRDSLKRGVDSAYRIIEDDGAQICADLRCPNPYIGIESLTGLHEAWWINMFAAEADTARVANGYATNRALSTALNVVAQRKATLIGTPVQGFAVYQRDLSRGPAWSIRARASSLSASLAIAGRSMHPRGRWRIRRCMSYAQSQLVARRKPLRGKPIRGSSRCAPIGACRHLSGWPRIRISGGARPSRRRGGERVADHPAEPVPERRPPGHVTAPLPNDRCT